MLAVAHPPERRKRDVVVGIAELAVSNDVEAELVTYGLGSCLGVLMHDPARKVAGLLHFMLPEAASARQKADENPMMFADTGVPALLQRMLALGCDQRSIVVKLVGGASLFQQHSTFDIGQRNCTIVRKLFWKAGMLIRAEDVGDSRSRTVRLSVATGQVAVHSQGKVTAL